MRSPQEGFTLIELMVVLALMVLLSGIILSWVGGIVRKNRIAQDIDSLFGVLQEARMLAFTQKRSCGLVWPGATFTRVELRCDTDLDGSVEDTDGYEVLRTVDLRNTFQDGARTSTVFGKEGFNFFPLTLCPVNNTNLPGDSCILVGRTRIKKGSWDGTLCDSDHCTPR